MSIQPWSRKRLAASFAAALLLLAAALLLAPSCERKAPAVEPKASDDTIAAVHPVLPENDPMRLFSTPENAVAPPPSRYPELAFTEFSEGLPTAGTWRGYPILHDLNQDQRADLVASNREEDGFSVWLAPQQGPPQGGPPQPWVRAIEGLPRDMGYGPVVACDVNEDGHIDLALSAHTDALRIYLNDGQQRWSRLERIEGVCQLLLDLAVGNLDGDGHADLVGLAHFKNGFFVYSGDGQGGFRLRPESAQILDAKTFGRDVELVDLDGDRLDDLVAATSAGLKVFLTRAGESLRWEEISAGLPVPKIGNSLYSVAVGRFAGDAWPEIAVCMVPDPGDPADKRNSIGVYRWQPDAQRWQQIDQGLDRDESYLDARSGDFNRDGKLDLLALSVQSGAVFYLGDGKGGFQAKGRLPEIAGKGRVALGDVDADGWLDVVVSIPASKERPEFGGLRVFLNRPAIWG